MKPSETVRMHRFNNFVALRFTDERTVYIDANLAARLGVLLKHCAENIKETAFHKSAFGIHYITTEN